MVIRIAKRRRKIILRSVITWGRVYRVLVMVYNTHNHLVFGLSPTSEMLKISKI
jgi:hypothetical protein